MSKLTRALVLTGVAVTAGLSVAGPAAASSATAPAVSDRSQAAGPAGQGKPAGQAGQGKPADRERFIGFFPGPRTCERYGREGEWRHRWDDYECFYVRRGPHRGEWGLKAFWDWDGPHGPGPGGPGGPPHGPWDGPGGPGGPGPWGGPGPGGPGGPGPWGPGGPGGPPPPWKKN
ncbi:MULTISPECIES: hypothetical protein [Actinoplanes]|uniref:hypothetical protein n=1 Tax=Actinoplanes TaxID=1865 RepID=UPI000A701722|nr:MULTISPECIES: hypothetical protein [Actinoplanes]GLY00569.1 hypothetical protein Acsp01_09480 [Actinoplanes sp. NBRC 101535]